MYTQETEELQELLWQRAIHSPQSLFGHAESVFAKKKLSGYWWLQKLWQVGDSLAVATVPTVLTQFKSQTHPEGKC